MSSEEMECIHIAEAAEKVNVDVEQMRATLNNRSCNVCVRVDLLWICMECKQILCGHNASGHSTAHYEYHKNHCLFLNIESAAIFCYKCDSDVEPKHHDDELNRLRQFILYNRGPSTVNSLKKRRQKVSKVVKSKKRCFKQSPRPNKNKSISNSGNDTIVSTMCQALSDQESNNKFETVTNAIVPKKALKTVKPKKVVFKRGPRTSKKIGLRNSGNNCFMNAVFQSLRHIKPFIYCLKLFKDNDAQHICSHIDSRDHNCIIAEELLKLLISLVDWKKPPNHKIRDAISPLALYTIVCRIKPQYKGYRQQDAHEFLMFTLDKLHSELRDEKNRLLLEEGIEHVNPNKIDTLVSLMFRGYLLSEVKCLICNTSSRILDPFTDISLHVPDYKNADDQLESQPVALLTDCLARYIEVEELNETNFYNCSTCKLSQKSTKRFLFNRLPNILCLHLKRFRYDATNRTKLHTHIKFPMSSLDMSQYLDNESKSILTKEAAYLFDLMAVVVHDGEGSGSGHYTSYALDENEGQWYEFNDERVHEIDASVVESVQAYLLFYIKREMKVNLCL